MAESNKGWWISIVVLILFFGAFFLIGFLNSVEPEEDILSVGKIIPRSNGNQSSGLIPKIIGIFFGMPESGKIIQISYNGLIILLAIFAMFAFSFGDILASFSIFSSRVSWVIGIAIAVILSVSGIVYKFTIKFVSLFAFMGASAVVGVILSAFVVAFAVSWGMTPLAEWVMMRKAMKQAAEIRANSAEGREQIIQGFKAAKEVGKVVSGETK